MKSGRNRPIGIFDSGVGGLTVAKSVRRYLPNEDIIYFGDTARVPYGNKSRSTIIRFSREIMEFMMKKRVKMAVVACNTASSLSLSVLKSHYPIPVVGVINPGVKEAIAATKSKRIGVIGTDSTISSGSYNKELKRLGRSYKLFSASCPLFVPLVENKFLNGEITEQVVRKYLKPLMKKNIDALILGCTHYPLLKGLIGSTMKGVKLVDSSTAVAKRVKEILISKNMQSDRNKKRGKAVYYVSDDPKAFRKVAHIFLREKIDIKRVDLYNYA